MFKRVIIHLRQQSKATRDQYAFAVAAGVTLVVVAVWGVSLSARFGAVPQPAAVSEAEPGPSPEALGGILSDWQADLAAVTRPDPVATTSDSTAPVPPASTAPAPAPAGQPVRIATTTAGQSD